jgi:pyridoxal 5'-phosphate synthase pdxS subunit
LRAPQTNGERNGAFSMWFVSSAGVSTSLSSMKSTPRASSTRASLKWPIRTKGEAGSGNIVEAVRHLRQLNGDMRAIQALRGDELATRAKELGASLDLIRYVHEHGKLPVPNFAAGGIATPADAALCMSLGAESVFVGSGIFKSADPEARAKAMVHATTHWQEPEEVLNASRGLGDAMEGIEMSTLSEDQRLANRGW